LSFLFLGLIKPEASNTFSIVSGFFCSNNACKIHLHYGVSFYSFSLLYNIWSVNYTAIYLLIIQLVDNIVASCVWLIINKATTNVLYICLGHCTNFSNFTYGGLIVSWEVHM
jgi:hypothetical protein